MSRTIAIALLLVTLLAGAAAAVDVVFTYQAPKAGEVYLAGDFNGWNAWDLPMTKQGGTWVATVDLPAGSHAYKFVVDGAWREDPRNKTTKADGYGGNNSVVTVAAGAAGPLAAHGGSLDDVDAPAAAPAAPAAGGGAGTEFRCSAPGAGAVFVAGEFNDWNPTADRLSDPDGDGVFTKTLPLAAGSYQYKFVVDGNWQEDPSAAKTADDGFGGKNSVVEVAQGAAPAAAAAPAASGGATFSYDAGGKVGSAYVAGEFNGWNPTGTAMTDPDGDGVYTASLPLDPGTYQYKFVVDGNWLQDPANPNGADDGFGGKNSVLTVGAGGAVATTPAATVSAPAAGGERAVRFRFTPVISGVGSVSVAGDFNGWDPAADPLTDPEQDGTYEVVLNLPTGEHAYKFVVDGEWHADPDNPNTGDDGFGGQNSLVNVGAGDGVIDAAAAPAAGAAVGLRTVPFSYAAGKSAANVFLAGTFNDWNDSKQRLTDADGDGVWETTLLLQPGSYQYKFVVDGNWTADPKNPNGADDGFGGQNSVLDVDASFAEVAMEKGDGRFFTADIAPVFDYSTCNPLTPTLVEITARAHLDDVESLAVRWNTGGAWSETPMTPAEADPAFRSYRARVELPSADAALQYVVIYRDGGNETALGAQGFAAPNAAVPFRYTRAAHPPFLTPDWAKDGVVYQIFPERFANGDKGNDPDFHEPWYQGANTLPPSGKTNGEYFHLVDDWYDVAGLQRSPYRTDGKPDYFSFYGGDIAGVRQHLDYLNDLGVTVLYFNPLNQGVSNHKYDPTDYNTLDPHFGTADEFKAFVKEAHARGIRIVVDVAFNHTGNWHFAFRDCVEKGSKSEYWNWYEWKKWPLPAGNDFNASDYYDCWWGFGLHPNLNWDLKRPNNAENNIADIADADPNMAVVDYVLGVADHWLGELDIDGFRLDVPNEVPFWFWKEFNKRCKEIKPDCWLVGEIWGNAGSWIGPHCFDATMNYKFFRDPVMEFFGQGRIDAATFDRRLAPGRSVYPPQSVQTMMNLIDSHDTIRFLTTAGDVRRLQLAALFAMNYVGQPHIWYGDEVGMLGGKDPDCRRPMDWRYTDDAAKTALRDYYGSITRFRRDHQVLSRGDVVTLFAQGKTLVMARVLGGEVVLSAYNAGPQAAVVELSAEDLAAALPLNAKRGFQAVAGVEHFGGASGGIRSGQAVDVSGGLTLELPGLSGVMLAN